MYHVTRLLTFSRFFAKVRRQRKNLGSCDGLESRQKPSFLQVNPDHRMV